MKSVLRAGGQLQKGFEVVAQGEMCIECIGAVEKEVSRWWHWVKCVLQAWGQIEKGV